MNSEIELAMNQLTQEINSEKERQLGALKKAYQEAGASGFDLKVFAENLIEWQAEAYARLALIEKAVFEEQTPSIEQ